MSFDPETTRIVRSWLDEGVTQLPDRVLDAVLDQVPATSQRRATWWPARRISTMNTTLKFGLAAVVVAAALIGISYLGSANVGSPGGPSNATPTAESTPVGSPSEAPSSAAEGVLPAGPFVIWDPANQAAPFDDGPPITVTLQGGERDILHQWRSVPEFAALVQEDGNSDPPDGSGMGVFSTTRDVYVYGDPCQWASTRPDTPATTVDELVDALAAQPSRGDSEPHDVTVGGYAGKSIRLQVPDDAQTREEAFADCDQNLFASFEVDGDAGPTRYHQGPGQIDELWVLDVDGAFVIIDVMYGVETNLDLVADLRAIAESATFELP